MIKFSYHVLGSKVTLLPQNKTMWGDSGNWFCFLLCYSYKLSHERTASKLFSSPEERELICGSFSPYWCMNETFRPNDGVGSLINLRPSWTWFNIIPTKISYWFYDIICYKNCGGWTCRITMICCHPSQLQDQFWHIQAEEHFIVSVGLVGELMF